MSPIPPSSSDDGNDLDTPSTKSYYEANGNNEAIFIPMTVGLAKCHIAIEEEPCCSAQKCEVTPKRAQLANKIQKHWNVAQCV